MSKYNGCIDFEKSVRGKSGGLTFQSISPADYDGLDPIISNYDKIVAGRTATEFLRVTINGKPLKDFPHQKEQQAEISQAAQKKGVFVLSYASMTLGNSPAPLDNWSIFVRAAPL